MLQKKKSLGQHFLRSSYYLSLIADAASIVKNDVVLEVGPGDGALTHVLLARGATVLAIEKDTRLIAPLREKFLGKVFELIYAAALDFAPPPTLKT